MFQELAPTPCLPKSRTASLEKFGLADEAWDGEKTTDKMKLLAFKKVPSLTPSYTKAIKTRAELVLIGTC
jgi:hypothetical protein